MKLTDTMNKSMKQILEDCEVLKQVVHTNDETGEICSIVITYRPKDCVDNNKKTRIPEYETGTLFS